MEKFILTIVEEIRTEVEIYAKNADDAERYYLRDKEAAAYETKNGRIIHKSRERHETLKPAQVKDNAE